MKWKILTLIGLGLMTSISAQDKFKIYGFAEFNMGGLSMKNNSILRAYIREDIALALGALNVYYDFMPTNNTRALIETRLKSTSVATIEVVDRDVINVERAWFEYKQSDKLAFRVGKFITPAGVWNVDHGSPIITTVGQPVQTSMFAIFPESQMGGMLNGRYFLGDHDLIYNLYVSSGTKPDNRIKEFSEMGVGGHLELKMDVLDGVDYGVSYMTGTERVDVQEMYIENDGGFGIDDLWWRQKDSILTRSHIYGAQFKSKFFGVVVQSEINVKNVFNKLNNDAETDYLAYYGLLSYDLRLNQAWMVTPYLFYESMNWENARANSHLTVATIPMEGWDTYTIGLNLGLYSNYKFKIEYGLSRPRPIGTSPDPTTGNLIGNNYELGDLDMNAIQAQFTMAF